MTLGKTRVTVEIEDKIFKSFKIACIEDGKDMSAVLRDGITTYLDNRKRTQIVT